MRTGGRDKQLSIKCSHRILILQQLIDQLVEARYTLRYILILSDDRENALGIVVGVLSNGLNLLSINSFWQYIVKGVVILIAVYVDFLKKRKKAN